ncbi:MAG: HD domain-containing protein, partial [Lentisphaerae bacterium]|nr:HD domain-containing protein [Lentisphaerota bacterium]
VQKLSLGRKTAGFVDLCGQLRFQKRWSQSPRIPATSVLGHMLVVAILTYLSLCEAEASAFRKKNGFLAGLFHDLPEVLTRDITSPIKGAVEGLDEIIKDYENKQMEAKLLPLLPSSWHKELSYYTENEFTNRALSDDTVIPNIPFAEMGGAYDKAECLPVDGEIIRCCDHLAAFIEATISIRHGISSRYLLEGVERLQKEYCQKVIGEIDYGRTFAAFVP